jgi:hypothetical protein
MMMMIYMSMENHGGVILTEENSLFVHQSSPVILQHGHLVANQEDIAKETINLALGSIMVVLIKDVYMP